MAKPTTTQLSFIYQKINEVNPLMFPAEYYSYNDNKLMTRLEELSEGQYKYLLAMCYQKNEDKIKELIYQVPL